jgi:hypothetical protein
MKTQSTPLKGAQIGIILLAGASALVHLGLSLSLGFDIFFFLNFVGYLAFCAAYFLPLPVVKDNRPWVRWGFMLYTLATILAWIFMGDKSWWVGIADKLGELFLLVLLWFDKP